MPEGVPENDEFLQIALAAHESITKEAAAKPAEAPPEPAAPVEPQAAEPAATGDDGKQPVAEAKPVETPPEPKPEPKRTDWKAAAANERARQAAKSQERSRLAQLEAEAAQLRAEVQRSRELDELAKTDPIAAAEKRGFSYDRLTQAYVKSLEANPNQPPPVVQQLDQKFQSVDERVARLERALAAKDEQLAIATFESKVSATLAAKAEEFELTKAAGDDGTSLVKNIAQQHWVQTATWKLDAYGNKATDERGNWILLAPGETLPTEEACKLAEAYFEQQQLKRFAETKKFRALVKTETPPKKDEPQPTKPAAASTATLSNQLRQGGGEAQSFSGEWEELAALTKRLAAQQGN